MLWPSLTARQDQGVAFVWDLSPKLQLPARVDHSADGTFTKKRVVGISGHKPTYGYYLSR
jgi:hypothetical protein